MFLAVCFILIIFMFIYFHFYIGSKIRSSNMLKKFKSEIDKTIIEINQATDRNVNIIEIKIESLNRIIKDVDERIEILDQRLRGFNSNFSSVTSNFSVKNDSSLYKSDLEFSIPSIKKNQIKESHDVRHQVLALYAEGMSLEIIAKKLKLDLGEVELIVSINRSNS